MRAERTRTHLNRVPQRGRRHHTLWTERDREPRARSGQGIPVPDPESGRPGADAEPRNHLCATETTPACSRVVPSCQPKNSFQELLMLRRDPRDPKITASEATPKVPRVFLTHTERAVFIGRALTPQDLLGNVVPKAPNIEKVGRAAEVVVEEK